MTTLTEIGRGTYGHDERAINKHSVRRYRDETGNNFVLSRTLNGIPPFFEAYGPFRDDYTGVLPRLRVMGQEYWGSGWNWRRALKAFLSELNATLRTGRRKK